MYIIGLLALVVISLFVKFSSDAFLISLTILYGAYMIRDAIKDTPKK